MRRQLARTQSEDERVSGMARYLEELLEHANALIVATDRHGKILVYNKLFSTLTGLSKPQVIGQELASLVPESERSRLLEMQAASLRGERISNFETRVLSRNGREARISLSCSPVFSDQDRGRADGVLAIGQDITAVKELERQIVQAEKLASLGQFAASVVHEINNPLTAIVSCADSLLSRWVPTQGSCAEQEKLRKILNSCERIVRFTRQLVSYARPVQDKPEQVELSALLDTAASFCDHILSHHGITLEKDYAQLPKLPAIKGNLAQVFVNLITNACQAMQPGGCVHLSTRLEGQLAVVRIRDTGPGIESASLDKIFEPFFTTKPDSQGTGLGLSIVQNIVENHGGTVEVESTIGEGTTFVVRFPTVPYTENITPSLTVNNESRNSAAC